METWRGSPAILQLPRDSGPTEQRRGRWKGPRGGCILLLGEEGMEKTSGKEKLTASITSTRVIVSEPPGLLTPAKAAPVALPLRLAPTCVLP